jgi:hypothetical protein
LATEGWIKSIWEKMRQYNFRLYLHYPTMALPRVGDITIVDLLVGLGIRGMTLCSFNRCRLKHEAIFLSEIAMAAGLHVDPQYLQPPTRKGQISFFNFPPEEPAQSNWIQWENFWCSYCLDRLRLPCMLGTWQASGHCIWEWVYNAKHDKIYYSFQFN